MDSNNPVPHHLLRPSPSRSRQAHRRRRRELKKCLHSSKSARTAKPGESLSLPSTPNRTIKETLRVTLPEELFRPVGLGEVSWDCSGTASNSVAPPPQLSLTMTKKREKSPLARPDEGIVKVSRAAKRCSRTRLRGPRPALERPSACRAPSHLKLDRRPIPTGTGQGRVRSRWPAYLRDCRNP